MQKHCRQIKVGGAKKSVPSSGKKTNYTVHYMNLQLYISLGIKLIKIHKILKFKESDWMKKIYILTSTLSKEKNAKNEFGKRLFKLMNNSVYDKKMENLRKRINVRVNILLLFMKFMILSMKELLAK